MPIHINSFTPNTKVQSAQINTNFANLKTAAENASYRSFTWGLTGLLVVDDEQGMQYIVPQDLTLKTLQAKTTSGTCDIRIQKDGTDLKTSFSVSSTVGSTGAFDVSTISEGDVLTLDVISISSATGLFVTLECQVTANI